MKKQSVHEMESPIIEKSPSKFYGFHSFAEAGFPNGAFRDNIRQFLLQCAEPEDYDLDGMPVSRIFLVYEDRGTVIPFYTVEENVKHSDSPFCDFCRSAGWSHHLVSKRKYHLIIPGNDEWNNPLDEGALDVQTHLLHGLIHSNGYGHLISINGIEGGSKFVCGREIMDLWDRICTALHVRQISVEDLSKKHEMDLRLLHGVSYGHSWFGRWGYRFCHGSFGVKEHNYHTAMDFLSSLELDQVIDDFSITNEGTIIKQMIHNYRDMSDTNLVTIRDLFRFMLTLKGKPPTGRYSAYSIAKSLTCSGKVMAFSKSPRKNCLFNLSKRLSVRKCQVGKEKIARFRKFSNLAANLDSRWPVRRLENVAEVIVEALKEKRATNKASSSGMTRQEARDAARLHIGDTGLIDHVLKVLNNVIVGNYIVRRAVNRCSKILEYTIQDVKDNNKDSFCTKAPVVTISPGERVHNDITYLYKNVLRGYPESESVEHSVQMILHSKHFVKDWPFRDDDEDSLRFACRLTASSIDLIDDFFREFPLGELISVPLYATLGDLKIAVRDAMRDTYCATEKLTVSEILGTEGVQDEEVLFGLVESGSEIWARGCGLDLESKLRFQGGTENWTVRCKCGAQDDDGERMVSCDVCEAWQHTRCSGIEDEEVVPRLFVCDLCCTKLAPVQTRCGFTYDYRLSYDNQMMMMMPEDDIMGLLHSH